MPSLLLSQLQYWAASYQETPYIVTESSPTSGTMVTKANTGLGAEA